MLNQIQNVIPALHIYKTYAYGFVSKHIGKNLEGYTLNFLHLLVWRNYSWYIYLHIIWNFYNNMNYSYNENREEKYPFLLKIMLARWGFWVFFKILFIWKRESTSTSRRRGRGRKEREADSLLSRKPDPGLGPRPLGSWPELKADT